MGLGGHLWTIGVLARRRLAPRPGPPEEAWSTVVRDPAVGPVRLTGRLARPAGARTAVVLVHGLGGSADSGYLVEAAAAAHDLGLASLRLSLRGADGLAPDIYHAGLTEDARAAAEVLGGSGFERVVVLGFSLGGHIALRLATQDEPPVAAVAAFCAPLDLAAAQRAIDGHGLAALYRTYLLRNLKRNYRRLAALGPLPASPARVERVRTLRQWDALTVVPRFGFDDPDDYYARASVGPRLERLRRPALLVAIEADPMVPPAAIRPSLAALGSPPPRLTVRWLARGGHVATTRKVDLTLGSTGSLEAQLLRWLVQR